MIVALVGVHDGAAQAFLKVIPLARRVSKFGVFGNWALF